MIKHINGNEFNSEVLKETGVVVVDFFANWCGPCKMLSPVLEEIQGEMKDVKIVKVDVDQNQELAGKYGVQNIPTIKIFKAGDECVTKTGFLPKGNLEAIIKEYI